MPRSIPSISDCKIRASLLLKRLNSADGAEALEAAALFAKLPPFSSMSPEAILKKRDEIQRKHALEAVAREEKYASWKALKDAADVAWYPRSGSAFLNAWYATHAEARECLERNGGYLLTYRGKCFVCGRDFIAALGLDPDDPRWAAIGFDCMMPEDKRAYAELVKLAEARAKAGQTAEPAKPPVPLPS